ncbi:TetR/AcrR family transcriptional regulator [Paenibacillus hamazuiensis]|uniref:TetR/AcrR family transcriptional regulator n=1 Tax=Paenibacillus hamazuiensis TaxID=2936508 RepID=UPI002010720A|nr:TetR/AcrR family transcriptional regulator [Paenibacillus hamazuiensis]
MELRDRIMEAAEQAIRTYGLSRTTTKEIARIADCSEGSLYNHFQSKEDLFLQIMQKHVAGFSAVILKLPELAGARTVEENLEEVALAALNYFYSSIIMTASMFTEPGFLTRHRQGFQQRNAGPHRANEVVSSYLLAEQKLGRADAGINPRSAADMLLGACFQHVFHQKFLGAEESAQDRQQYVRHLLQALLKGLQPG